MLSTVEMPAIEPGTFRPLKRGEYDRLIELGLFRDEPIELLWGVLVTRSSQTAPRAATIANLTELFGTQLSGRFGLRIQLPLALSDESEPEPDVAIVARCDYSAEHPATALLVIEVSDSSLEIDRKKAALYADAGILNIGLSIFRRAPSKSIRRQRTTATPRSTPCARVRCGRRRSRT